MSSKNKRIVKTWFANSMAKKIVEVQISTYILEKNTTQFLFPFSLLYFYIVLLATFLVFINSIIFLLYQF